MRHGPAGEREDWTRTGRPDAERPLTPEGRRKVKDAARGLSRLLGEAPDLVATSPWARARQTAELVAAALGGPLVESALLLPHRTPKSLAAWLSGLQEETVVLVGHEPHLSRFASWLMTGLTRPVLSLKKGQALLLEAAKAEPGGARLVWSAPPRLLRR